MQLYGCDISSLLGVNGKYAVFLVGFPRTERELIYLELSGNLLSTHIPNEDLEKIKLMVYSQFDGTCKLYKMEAQNEYLLIDILLMKRVCNQGNCNKDAYGYFQKQIVTIGKRGFYSVPAKCKKQQCHNYFLRASYCNILGRKINGVAYASTIVPEEKNRAYFVALRKLISGSRIEEKDMIALFINEENIIEPFHIDIFKDFIFRTPEFCFTYNQIDAVLEIAIQEEEKNDAFKIKEDLFWDFPDMYITKICQSIQDNTLKENIVRYFV